MGGDAEHRDARAVAIEQAIDEVQIARPAAARADGQLSRQMRLGAGRECGDLLVPYMEPLDLAMAADGIRQPIEAVADDAIDALDPRGSQRFHELVSNDPRHDVPFRARPKAVRRCSRAYRISIMQISNIASPCLPGLSTFRESAQAKMRPSEPLGGPPVISKKGSVA